MAAGLVFRNQIPLFSVSASNKSRLKVLGVTHLLLGLLHNARLLPALLPRLGLPLPALPAAVSALPPPADTEYAWLLSLPFVFMALSACKRSKAGQWDFRIFL